MQKNFLSAMLCVTAAFNSSLELNALSDNCKSPDKSALEITVNTKQPVLLLEVIDQRRLTRAFVKNVLLRAIPMAIFVHYSKIFSFLLFKIEFSTFINALERLGQYQQNGVFNLSGIDPSVAPMSREVSPVRRRASPLSFPLAASPEVSLEGDVNPGLRPILAQRRQTPTPEPIRFASSPQRSRQNTPAPGRRGVVFEQQDPFARSAPTGFGMGTDQRSCPRGCSREVDINPAELEELRNRACLGCDKATEKLDDHFFFLSKHGIAAKVLNYCLPAIGIAMFILSFYLESYLDERLGRRLISMLDKDYMIKVPDNEFVRLTFETFAIGGYMFEKSRIVSNVRTLRAACKAIEERNLAMNKKTEYVHWSSGRFVS